MTAKTIVATVCFPISVEIEIDEDVDSERKREIIFAKAEKDLISNERSRWSSFIQSCSDKDLVG